MRSNGASWSNQFLCRQAGAALVDMLYASCSYCCTPTLSVDIHRSGDCRPWCSLAAARWRALELGPEFEVPAPVGGLLSRSRCLNDWANAVRLGDAAR